MSTAIVQLNVSQTSAPTPSLQQQLGALISQGATTIAAQSKSLLTQASDLTAILKGTLAITSITWLSSVATVTTTAVHSIPIGDTVELTIVGATPAGYNGTFACTSTGTSAFTYPLASNPGSETVPGSYTPEDVSELVAMVTTWFAQGSQLSIWVLELGLDGVPEGIVDLGTYITANTINGYGPFYGYGVPRAWAGDSTFVTFIGTYTALTAKTYFWTTMTSGQYASFANKKSVIGMIESPNIGTTEFSVVAPMFKALNYAPSAANKVTPFRYSNLFGVTQYPQPGNGANIATYLAAFVNLVLNGSEGGLTNTILRNGTTMDGKDFSYWYSVDWVQINIDRNVSAAVINGSNNPQNPLYYNQSGIDQLQAVIVSTMNTGVQGGMVLGSVVSTSLSPTQFATNVDNGVYAGQCAVNAWNFIDYSVANPNDFAAGIYSGFSIAFTPNQGFSQIIINVNVSSFV